MEYVEIKEEVVEEEVETSVQELFNSVVLIKENIEEMECEDLMESCPASSSSSQDHDSSTSSSEETSTLSPESSLNRREYFEETSSFVSTSSPEPSLTRRETSCELESDKEQPKHDQGPFTCSICHRTKPTLISLQWHLQNSHGKTYKDAVCPYCSNAFFKDLLAIQHLPKCKKNPANIERAKRANYLRCTHCGDESNWYKNLAALRTHLHKMHRELRVPCPYCAQPQFVDLRSAHAQKCIKQLDKANMQRALCPYCSKMVQKQGLSTHIRRLHNDEVYQCDLCPRTFFSKILLRNHIQQAHLGVKYPCKLCSDVLESQSQLVHHKRKKHPEVVPEMKCPLCCYITRDSGNLYQHLKGHAGESAKKHACKECGRKFLHLAKLKLHVVTHTEQRNHLCPICGALFKRQNDVKKHIGQVHSERGYECPVCLAKFGTNQNMRVHCASQHPEYELPPPGTVMKKNPTYKYNGPMTPLRSRSNLGA